MLQRIPHLATLNSKENTKKYIFGKEINIAPINASPRTYLVALGIQKLRRIPQGQRRDVAVALAPHLGVVLVAAELA